MIRYGSDREVTVNRGQDTETVSRSCLGVVESGSTEIVEEGRTRGGSLTGDDK